MIFSPLVWQDFETKMKLAQTNLSRRDSLKIARRFNAGNGLACASSPGGTAEPARPFRSSLRDSIHFAAQPGVETPGYCHSSLRDKTAGAILSKLRKSDLFVENRPAQAAQLRRSGIFGIQRPDAKAQRRQGTSKNFFAALRLCALALKNDAAPTELEIFSDARATKIPRLRRLETSRFVDAAQNENFPAARADGSCERLETTYHRKTYGTF
jgi:hypothetical protein